MSRKIKRTPTSALSIKVAFEEFVVAQTAKGFAVSTIQNYHSHFHSISKHIDIETPFCELGQVVPLCSQMVRILRDYCKTRGGGDSDYLFCDEYGEMLSPNALRLAIQRYNRSRGVEKTSLHLFRHTFARKYLIDCGGDAFMLQKLLGHSTLKMTRHYLFCNECGGQLTESALRQGIARYNQSRGLSKTGTHLFRHTFARKYLMDCGGNAFTLQKLLGHSTLKTTKIYCNIFDADIARNYDEFSPLAQIKSSRQTVRR